MDRTREDLNFYPVPSETSFHAEWRWGEVALPVPREIRLVRQPRIASAVRKLAKPPATATLPEQWQRQMLGMQLLEPLLATGRGRRAFGDPLPRSLCRDDRPGTDATRPKVAFAESDGSAFADEGIGRGDR